MANINKNIIMQAGAAVANATNKAAGLSAATPEPGAIISAIQLVNGGRTIGPDALAHFTESVRNKLLSLLVSMEPIQSGSGTPSPDNVRPISGRTGAHVYVSPTSNVADATTYSVDWTSEAGTVYSGTVDVVTGVLTVDKVLVDLGTLSWAPGSTSVTDKYRFLASLPDDAVNSDTTVGVTSLCSQYVALANGATYPAANNGYTINGSKVYIYDASHATDNGTTFQNAMSGVQLVYKLTTPLTYQLSSQDVVTLVGYNYIWSDSGDVTITE